MANQSNQNTRRNSYTNDEKREFVQKIERGDLRPADVARDVGLSPQAISNWVKTYGRDAKDPRSAGRPRSTNSNDNRQRQMRAASREPQEVQDMRKAAETGQTERRPVAGRNEDADFLRVQNAYFKALIKRNGIDMLA